MHDVRGRGSDDPACGADRPAESAIERKQRTGEGLRERHVPAIVDREVVAHFPCASGQRFEREQLDVELEQVTLGEIGFTARESIGKLQPAKDVSGFDEGDLRTGQPTCRPRLRDDGLGPGTLRPRLGGRGREDRGVNDDRHFRSASRASRMLSVVTRFSDIRLRARTSASHS